MKKVYLIFGIAGMMLAVSCSNEGAFSEEEKKKQDSIDNARQPSEFEKLEKQQAEADSLERLKAGKTDDKKLIKPQDLPGGAAPDYVPPAPEKQQPANGELPPGPPPQQPKR